jgi:hypothetical protein
MDWFRENYPTGRLYTYTGSMQGILPGVKAKETFIHGRPYLFVRWNRPTNPYTKEKCGFLNAVFFVGGAEVLIDRGMLKEFELI